jgi:hypothetical protein
MIDISEKYFLKQKYTRDFTEVLIVNDVIFEQNEKYPS